jgi:hypothetical protein
MDDGLHRPVNADWRDEDDWVRCGTCGTDLYALGFCPDVPTETCGCPTYAVRDGEHMPHD